MDNKYWDADGVVPGSGDGPSCLLAEPLSFWGGYDAETGRIVEARHPQYGAVLTGSVLLMASAKGSSSSSSVLAEAIRNGTGPAAIVMRERDLIVALGCIVAAELYAVHVPIVAVDAATWSGLCALPPGTRLRVRAEQEDDQGDGRGDGLEDGGKRDRKSGRKSGRKNSRIYASTS